MARPVHLSAIGIGIAALSLNFSAPERAQAQNVDGATPAQPSEAAATTNAEQESAATFKSVVIAGVPRALSILQPELASTISELTGVAVKPEWFHLDLASFTLPEAVKPKEFAAKLGMDVVSDVSDTLLLSSMEPADPRNRQAEARLFLKRVFVEKPRAMWSNILGDSRSDQVTKPTEWGGWQTSVEPAPAHESAGMSESLVFAGSGTLDDPKVQAALGLTADDLNIPLKHFTLKDFKLAGKESTDNDNYYNYRYYDGYGYSSNSGGGQVVITAGSGKVEQTLKEGPEFEVFNLNDVANLIQSILGYGYTSYGYWGSSPRRSGGQQATTTDPHYVALVMDDIRTIPLHTEKSLSAYRTEIKQLRETNASQEAIQSLYTEMALTHRRDRVAGRARWGDANAQAMQGDSIDHDFAIRAAKRKCAESLVKVMKKLQPVAADKPRFVFGRLYNSDVEQRFQFDYNDFNARPYAHNNLEFVADDSDPNAVILQTVSDEPAVEGEMSFKVKCNADTLEVTWLAGEPEAEERITQRKQEIRRGTEYVLEQLKQNALKLPVTDAALSALLAKCEEPFLYVSELDFTIREVVPGWVRVGAELGPGSKQGVLYNHGKQQIIWETLPPQEPKPSEDNDPEYYYEFE